MQIERKSYAKNITWSGATDSAAVDGLGGASAFHLYLPATFAGTALTFKAKVGSAYYLVHNNGADLTVTVAAAKVNVLPAELFGGFDAGKFVSDQSETCVGELHGQS